MKNNTQIWYIVRIDNNNIAIWDKELVQVHKKEVLLSGKWSFIKNKIKNYES